MTSLPNLVPCFKLPARPADAVIAEGAIWLLILEPFCLWFAFAFATGIGLKRNLVAAAIALAVALVVPYGLFETGQVIISYVQICQQALSRP